MIIPSSGRNRNLILRVGLIDTFAELLKHLLDVKPIFRRYHVMIRVVQLSKFLYLIIVYLATGLQIGLVTRYSQHETLGSVFLQLTHPLLHLLKTLARGDLVGHYGSHCLAVVYWSDSVVLFLSGSVLGK